MSEHSSHGLTTDQVRQRTVPLIVSYGGGVNSLAVLVGLRERQLRPDVVIFADTGGEKPSTYQHLTEVVEPYLSQLGFPALTRVQKRSPRTGDRTLEAECLRRETLPSRAFGLSSCAFRWKIEPQEVWLNHWEPARAAWAVGTRPIKILGYDASEPARARIHDDKKLCYWYPLMEWGWDRGACLSAITAAGLPRPPKSACFFCPSSTKQEVLDLQQTMPELYTRATRLEQIALRSTRHTLLRVRGLGRKWDWTTLPGLSPEVYAQLPEAPVESCTACVDEGADE